MAVSRRPAPEVPWTSPSSAPQFPALRTRAYLFAGALTPAAKPVRAAWDDWTDSWQYDPNFVYTGPMMTGRMDELRAAFGRLIGGDPASVSLTDNTCRAANIGVGILSARPGSNVVVDDGTYPSSVYPWRAHGQREVRLVHTDGVADAASLIAEQVDDETTAVCITTSRPSPAAATTCARWPRSATRTARC